MKFTIKKILFISLITLTNAFSQTNDYVAILGTKCSILAPKDFLQSTSFSGLQNVEKSASIMINELPSSYFFMSENFTAENLKSKGMILISKESVDFNNSKATYIKVSQNANGMKYIKQLLMFGDENKTILVNGIYPEKFKSLEDEIKTSIFSTKYNENQNENSLEAVDFEIDVTNTDFKYAKNFSGTIIYSIEGKMPTEKPIIMVGNSISNVNPKDKRQYSIDRLKKLPNGESMTIESINPITIDNIDGYEIIANGKNSKEEDEKIYQVMLYDETSGYYMIIGMASQEKEEYLKKFKEIAKSFHLK